MLEAPRSDAEVHGLYCMRVLHVITALGVGGAERMLLNLLGAAALRCFEQRVVALLPGGALAPEMRATGARVDELDLLGALRVFRGTRGLVRIATAFDADVVQGWMYHGNMGASIARRSRRRRVPLVWGVRQSLASLHGENAFARAAIRLNRAFSRDPDRILFNSHASLAQHRAFGFDPDRMQYLPNGFDTTRFAPDAAARAKWRAAWGTRDDEVVFGLIARHHPAKNHAGLLRAARTVAAARPGCRFVLAGPGVDRAAADLSDLSSVAALQGRVHLLGDRRDVPELMAALDVYVSPSTAIEAFSNSIGEALCCALPCIATEVGDSPRLVGEEGRIVSAGDEGALAQAMIELIDAGAEARRALGLRARQRMRADYDLEAVAARYANLYRELTGRLQPAAAAA
jgi:glycosyltransferase involved in cell wall biosynthesis